MASPIGEPGRDHTAPDDEIQGEDPIVLDNSRIMPGDNAPDDDLVVLDNGRTSPGDGAPPGQQVVLEGELVLDEDQVAPDDDQVAPGGDRMATANGESGRQPSAAAASAHSAAAAGRWPDIQAMFVDDPRASVERAAGLVDDCVEALVVSVTERQQALRSDWQGTGTDTEELRTALQRYRTFWNRLEDFSHQS